jgi:hypothetical protein
MDELFQLHMEIKSLVEKHVNRTLVFVGMGMTDTEFKRFKNTLLLEFSRGGLKRELKELFYEMHIGLKLTDPQYPSEQAGPD